MLDNILIITTIVFLIVQLIVSGQIILLVMKSKKEGGIVVSNFWFISIPFLLLIYTVIMLFCSIKTNDTMLVLMPIALSMCFLFDMHIFYANGKDVKHYYFLLQKNICTSLDVNDRLVVADCEDKKIILRLSDKKIMKLKPYLKTEE